MSEFFPGDVTTSKDESNEETYKEYVGTTLPDSAVHLDKDSNDLLFSANTGSKSSNNSPGDEDTVGADQPDVESNRSKSQYGDMQVGTESVEQSSLLDRAVCPWARSICAVRITCQRRRI